MKTIVTTSWDDGHVLDLKLAELLRANNLKGTFYVAPEDHEFTPENRLTPTQIRKLSKQFEIGAHTITHPRLPQVSDEQARTEITDSKSQLEAIIERPVLSFCYPGGEYRDQHVAAVRDAGYTYARTVDRFAYALGSNALLAPSSIHAYRHWSDLWQIMVFARFNPIQSLNYLLNWDQLAIAMFNRIHAAGGIFHLWGHSWEIAKNGDWSRLERVLRHIAGHVDVEYRTNGELV